MRVSYQLDLTVPLLGYDHYFFNLSTGASSKHSTGTFALKTGHLLGHVLDGTRIVLQTTYSRVGR